VTGGGSVSLKVAATNVAKQRVMAFSLVAKVAGECFQ
jgi:hypothetical protein